LTRMNISITEYLFKVHQPDGKRHIPESEQFSDTLTLVRICRRARGARLQRRVQLRPTGLCERCAPALRAFAPRVSRSDARGDAEHEASAFAGGCNLMIRSHSPGSYKSTRRLLSLAGATLSNQTNLCENCYK